MSNDKFYVFDVDWRGAAKYYPQVAVMKLNANDAKAKLEAHKKCTEISTLEAKFLQQEEENKYKPNASDHMSGRARESKIQWQDIYTGIQGEIHLIPVSEELAKTIRSHTILNRLPNSDVKEIMVDGDRFMLGLAAASITDSPYN